MGAKGRRPRGLARLRTMDELKSLSVTEITLALSALVALVGFAWFIVAPAWASYGRLWERMAAGFLSLYIGAALLGVGIAAGVGVIALYLELASG